MKKIIALIIDPEHSNGLIKYSIQLAERLESYLHLLYVEDPDPFPLGAKNLSGQAVKEVQLSLKNKARRVKHLLSKHAEVIKKDVGSEVMVEVSCDIGKESVILNRMIEDALDSYMVIVENRDLGKGWYKNDKTRGIVLSVACPVWVIPTSFTFGSFDQIVYATDYNQEDIPVLKKVIGTMKPFFPQLTALHVTNDVDFDLKVKQTGFQELLKQKTEYDHIIVETLIENEGEDLATAINNYCQTFGTDLIVLLKENTGFLEKMFTESPTLKILKQVELPVLIYHQN